MRYYIKPNTKYTSIVEKEMMMAASPNIHNKVGGEQLGKRYNGDDAAFEDAENSSIWDD
ncbi:hypothetical protein HMPREF1870_00964 [Bacteroidales bacterium KA00344]|nr:hypothetical protein HMPREF1870_00964 [Bacteroidales bacterium KA00344]